MKICYLKNWLGIGGNPEMYSSIVNNISNEEASITICYIEGAREKTVEEFREAGAQIRGFNARSKFDLIALFKILRFFRRQNFDIIHAHQPYAQSIGRIIGRISGTKNIIGSQSSFPTNYHPVTRILERWTRSLDSRTVAESKGVQEAFTGTSNYYEPGQDSQWCTIHNGIDVEKFNTQVGRANPENIKNKWGIEDVGNIVLSVGRYVPAKSQQDMVLAMEEVVREVPDSHLLMVGYGELKENLRHLIQQRGLSDKITLTGRTYSVHDYYAAADVFTISSVTEGFGIVVLEAMASKLPVVGTDIPALSEIIKHNETGFLVPPKSPKELSERIIRLLYSEDIRSEFAENGWQRVQNEFDIQRVAEEYLTMYQELVDSDG
jgi:glycosyltransferase involved in cell wall biosynthesis